ncbi:UDP-N-acetylmuramate--L-alanine ligase [Tunturiibacter gelidoferens]|jgi:UDP-N-acetylmuramate--alanine ligase|uniref:UDP-N-acetylmuramate--L-alanine ligase n=1 Tax=Tunturiibacter gelidiferens TaxID=3069689 RepID=A0A9X0QE61_9BACT|nr:UDP-N-acetylmuramate--L-alanine ligase [Edaphobacter lichenicola]MBB5328633.1 UDP-N-acetylmuramate--alanine ligase [Edaphobacter lichenicola]
MFVPGHFLFAPSQRIHFIGIGGIGMSGIAEILLTMGYSVSGSDLRRSSVTDRLLGMGARIFEGHVASNAAASDVVVTSSAVAKDNPEVVEARERKIPVIQRAEMLAELMRLKYGIAVAGMHGKTTTTSMVAAVLAGGGLDPTVVVGGRVNALGSNARLGNSQYLVAEADESDRSFLKLSPVLAVVTNLDREHMDCYRDMEDVEGAFVEFMDRLPFYGATTACTDNSLLRTVLPRVRRKIYTYGESVDADFRVEVLPKDEDCHSCFAVNYKGLVLGKFRLHVPGRHNVLNATAAVAVGVQLGVAPDQIAAGLETFRGVDRRFQIKGEVRGVTVVDDYGHHPTEILATLRAARDCGYSKVHVLFQPHRFTRTRDLMTEFAGAFKDADSVEVLDIYAASEQPIEGIDAQALVKAIRDKGGERVEYAASVADGVAALVRTAKEGDLILTLGAGSVSQAGATVLEALATNG